MRYLVTLGFFDDILIPREGLQYPSRFDEREQLWIWEYKPDENEEHHDMYMDKGESIRFKVTGEVFCDTTPIPSSQSGGQEGQQAGHSQAVPSTAAQATANDEETTSKIPYSITVSIKEDYGIHRGRTVKVYGFIFMFI
jgi:DNA-directed RNA polymerase subunit E'/Rpb7